MFFLITTQHSSIKVKKKNKTKKPAISFQFYRIYYSESYSIRKNYMWTNYSIRTIKIVAINLCFFWCESTLVRSVITIVETIASSRKNNSVWFSKIITLNSFWTRAKKLLLLQVVRKPYDKLKCFYSELLELSAYFQMQININVNVLTKVETITSNSILFSNFNDY